MPIYRDRGWFLPLASDAPVEAGDGLREYILRRNQAAETGLEEIFVCREGKPYSITVGEELVGEGRVFAILTSDEDLDLLYVITERREPRHEAPVEIDRQELLDEVNYIRLKAEDSTALRN